MGSPKKLLDFYINSSIHVALAVVSLCVVTYWKFDASPSLDLLGFVFFGTITGYNFVKYAEVAKLHHRSLARSLKTIQIFSFISFLVLIWFSLMLPAKILFWIALFGTLTLLYALPVFSKRRNLRSISGIKILIISLVWAGVTVLLPVLQTSYNITEAVTIEFIQRFLFILVLILPFEIRDLKYDLKQLGTIPQKIGVTKTKVLAISLLLMILLLEIVKHEEIFLPPDLLLICFTVGLLVYFSKTKQSKYYASLWVEAAPILWVVILFLFRLI